MGNTHPEAWHCVHNMYWKDYYPLLKNWKWIKINSCSIIIIYICFIQKRRELISNFIWTLKGQILYPKITKRSVFNWNLWLFEKWALFFFSFLTKEAKFPLNVVEAQAAKQELCWNRAQSSWFQWKWSILTSCVLTGTPGGDNLIYWEQMLFVYILHLDRWFCLVKLNITHCQPYKHVTKK